jgi:hypothetical protein
LLISADGHKIISKESCLWNLVRYDNFEALYISQEFNILNSDILVHQIFFLSGIAISVLSAMITYTYGLYVEESEYAYVVGLFGFWISYYVNEFCSHIVSNM